MRAQDAISWVDDKFHNVYSGDDKLRWLSQVEAMARELAQRHGVRTECVRPAPDTRLLIPGPYDQLYLRWLEAQINYANQEYLKYNNAMTVFNTLWQEYANWFVRGHLTNGEKFRC